MRGYTQAQLEPEEAVDAMAAQLPGLDRDALSTALDEAIPTWTAGAPYFGELSGSSSVPRRRGRTSYCERMRRNSWRTDSGRPHIWVTSTRPSRTSRRTSSPAIPASSSSFKVPCTTKLPRRARTGARR